MGGSQKPQATPTNEKPDRRSYERKQHALRQQLPHDASTAGAHRASKRNLPMAAGGADQRKIGDIRTADQKHQADRTQHDQKFGAGAADDEILERNDFRADLRVRIGILLLEALRNGLKLRARRSNRDAGFHTPDRPELVLPPGAEILKAHVLRRIDVRSGRGAKPGGQHTHERVFLAIEVEFLPHDVFRAAEMLLPEAIAKDGDVISTRLVFALDEGPAEDRCDAKQREEVALGADHVGALRLARAAGVHSFLPSQTGWFPARFGFAPASRGNPVR